MPGWQREGAREGGREAGSEGEEGQREGRGEQTRRIKQREQIITIAHGAHNDHNNPPRMGFMELI